MDLLYGGSVSAPVFREVADRIFAYDIQMHNPVAMASSPKMGGYELPVSLAIFRGRYRESFSTPKPLASNQPLAFQFGLPTANHTFQPGHRVMVQVQSSLFPLYDRNPQTYVDNIFFAKPGDYRKATQRVYVSPEQPSYISLPVR